MREKSRWTDAHIALQRIWDERPPQVIEKGKTRAMTQEEFGEKFDLGTQTMVSQYLTGKRPLNYDACAKFARGLGCSIDEICPDMARAIYKDLFPVLRGSLRRRRFACVALMSALAASLVPAHDAHAFDKKSFSTPVLKSGRNTHWMQTLLSAFRKLCARFRTSEFSSDKQQRFAYN